MGCIKKISKAYSSSSKLRSRLIVGAIMVSTILVLLVGSFHVFRKIGLTMSYEKTMAEYDGFFMYVNDRQIEEVKSNENVVEYAIIDVTIAKANFNNEQFCLQNVDANYMDRFNYNIDEGFYPVKENEIALTKNVIKEQNINIGDKINLNLINKKDNSVQSKEFILTGIVEDRGYDKYKSRGFISKKYIDNVNENETVKNIYISVEKSLKSPDLLFRQIAQTSGIKISQMRYRQNLGNSIDHLLVAILIIIFGIFTISSIFSYSIIERVNSIGLLKAVGMTNKQLRKLFSREWIWYYIKGIPISIIIGSVMIYSFILKMVYKADYAKQFTFMEYIKTYISIGVRDNVFLSLLIFILFLEAIGVWLAFKIPSRKVKKMSVIDSINYIDKIKTKKTKIKNKKIKNPSFKLAYVYINNNRLKTVLSVLAISISVILFMYFSHFFTYNTSELSAIKRLVGDIGIKDIDYNDLSYINEIEGIESKAIMVGTIAKTPIDDIEIAHSSIEKLQQLQKYKDNNEDADINIYGFNDSMLELKYKYMKTPYTLEELKTMEDWCMVFDVDIFDEYNYNIGHTFIINNKEIKVVGEIDVLINDTKYITPPLLIKMDFINNNYTETELNYSQVGLNIKEDRYDDVKSKIVKKFKYKEEEYGIYYIDEELNEFRQKNIYRVSIMNIFVIMTAIISLCMVINIIYASIINRKKEFGMLRAIGMTEKQLTKYLYYEGNILITLITVVSIPISYIILKLNYNEFISFPENSGFAFKFPYWCLIIIPVYYVIIRLIIKISFKKINKESVVDLIRCI